MAKTPKREGRICTCGEHAWVPLTKGFVTFVDPEDLPFLVGKNWHALVPPGRFRTVYAVRSRKASGVGWTEYLHRAIVGHSNQLTDHEDRCGLNNRKRNLRLATSTQNLANARCRSDNSSGFKGVNWHVKAGKWMARIQVNDRQIYLGLFDIRADAAAAYDKAVKIRFGAFARTNFGGGING